MQDFIAQVTEKFGMSEGSASSLTGGLLAKVKEAADSDTFSQLTAKVPGIQGLIDSAGPSEGGGGGGLLGGLASAVGLGGGGGDLMGLVSKSGLDISKIGDYVQSLASYLKEKAGDGVVGELLSKVPGLDKFLD